MATERSTLLNDSVTYGTHGEESRIQVASLEDESSSLIKWAKQFLLKPSTSTSERPEPFDPIAELAVLLYAVHLLSQDLSTTLSIRASLGRTAAGQRVQAYLSDSIEDLLDAGGSALLSDGASLEEEDDVEGAMWRLWPIRNNSEKGVCIIDLLLPPYVPWPKASPFLSHPFIRHVLEHTWYNGGSSARSMPASTLSRLKRQLEISVTPFRVHLLQLVSYLILFALTMVLAIRPPVRIFPYKPDDETTRYSSVEVLWAIWTAASFIEVQETAEMMLTLMNRKTFQRKTPLIRFTVLVPTYLTLLLIPVNGQSAYSLITISIPTLTILLILPIAPSLPLLFHSILPLSTLLLNMLHRSIRSAGLLMPLVIGLFILFAWSMNGDIFRGVFRFSNVLLPTPTEPGIAPFEARLWIFITVILLLIFSIALTISRAIMPIREGWDDDGTRRWKGANKEGDEWEKEYGVTVARLARRRFALAVQELVQLRAESYKSSETGDVSRAVDTRAAEESREAAKTDLAVSRDTMCKLRPVVVPFNLVCVPFDILCGILPIVTRLWMSSTGGMPESQLRGMRDKLAICIMGPPCVVLGLIGRLVTKEHVYH